jgi:hypothetical protein
MLIRYYLAGASLKAKQDFAVGMIKDEQDDMDRRGWDVIMSEACFGELPRTDISRYPLWNGDPWKITICRLWYFHGSMPSRRMLLECSRAPRALQ